MNTVTSFYSSYVIDNRLYLKEPIKIGCYLYDDVVHQIGVSLSELPIIPLEFNKYIDMDTRYNNHMTTITISPNHGFVFEMNDNRYVYFCGDIGVFLEDKCKTKYEIVRDKRNKNLENLLD